MLVAQKERFVNATELESQFQKKVQSYRGTLAAIAYQSALQTIKEAPTADVAPVRPELRKAVELLEKNYEQGLNSNFVRDSLAWALYQTWKAMD